METRYRLEAARGAGRRTSPLGVVVRVVSCLLILGLLAACQPPADKGTAALGQGTDRLPAPEKLPIIVNLAVGDGSGEEGGADGDTIAAVTARVMERLKAAMPAEELAVVRTYNFLPAIGLSADGALIARLLAMPEVASIERDRELRLDDPLPSLRVK